MIVFAAQAVLGVLAASVVIKVLTEIYSERVAYLILSTSGVCLWVIWDDWRYLVSGVVMLAVVVGGLVEDLVRYWWRDK